MMRACDLDLLPLTLKLVRRVARVVEYLPVNVVGTTTIRWRFMGYWAWASVYGARRHRYGSTTVAASCCCLEMAEMDK